MRLVDIITQWASGIPYLRNKYIFALVIIAVFIVLAIFILIVFEKYLSRIAKKTKSNIDDIIFDHTKKPLFFFVLVWGVKLALLHLDINGIVTKTVNSLMALVFLYIFLKVVDVVIHTWGVHIAKKTKSKLDEVLLPLLHKVINVLFVIIGLLWVLRIWKIDITPYLAGVGISGLVLGLALQDSLKNVFGGISLLLDKNFSIDDPIRLETGELGVVKEIGLRSTKMVTYDNEVIFIPNGQLANMRIHNFVQPNTRVRKIVDFAVGYGTDPEKVKKIVLDTLKKIKNIHDDPYMDVIFVQMGDSGLHFKARFWADWSNAYDKWVEATQAIYTALQKAKIEIPFPQMDVHLKK